MISSRMRASRVGLRFILQSRRPWSSLPALGPIQERLGREVNPTIYRPEELAAPRSFVRRVLDGPKIMLVGTDDDIAKLAALDRLSPDGRLNIASNAALQLATLALAAEGYHCCKLFLHSAMTIVDQLDQCRRRCTLVK